MIRCVMIIRYFESCYLDQTEQIKKIFARKRGWLKTLMSFGSAFCIKKYERL